MKAYHKIVVIFFLTTLPFLGSAQNNSVYTKVIQNRVKEYTEVYKLIKGREQLTNDERKSINDMIRAQYKNEINLDKKAKKYDIKVTNQEMQEILEEGTHPLLLLTPFVNNSTHKFDIELYQKFQSDYKNKKYSPKDEKAYRRIYSFCTYLGRSIRYELIAQKVYNIENQE